MQRRELPRPATRHISRRLRQLLLVLQQKIENIFHQSTTSLCEAVEVQIASTIVSLDREERDRLLLPEEGDVVQIFLDESERSDDTSSRFDGFLKAFMILSINRDIFSRFDECGPRNPTNEQQLHLQHQNRRDAYLQRPPCQHRPHQQDVQERNSRLGHRQQPQGGGWRGGPQQISSRSSRRSRSRRARRTRRPSDHTSPGPSSVAAAGQNDVSRAPGRSHRQHHSGNSDHYCRCDHMQVGVQRPNTDFQEETRQEKRQEGQRHGERQHRQPVGGDRAVDLRLTRRDGPARPTGRSPPPSYRDATRHDSAQPDLRHRLSQREKDRSAGDDSAARTSAQCTSTGQQEGPVPAPSRVIQRQRPVPHPSSGPPHDQSLGAIPKPVPRPQQEPPSDYIFEWCRESRYGPRQLLPLVDCDKTGGFDRQGPALILSAHPPGPCDGTLTIFANNGHRTNDKNQRYCYQRLFMPNRDAPGSILYVGADTFLNKHWPAEPANPANERKPGDRAPRTGPPAIPAFESNHRHAASAHQPAVASPKGDERQPPIYEEIIDDGSPVNSGQPASIPAHSRREETDEERPGTPTVDLCSDGEAPDAHN